MISSLHYVIVHRRHLRSGSDARAGTLPNESSAGDAIEVRRQPKLPSVISYDIGEIRRIEP